MPPSVPGFSCPLAEPYYNCPRFRKSCDAINCEASIAREHGKLWRENLVCPRTGETAPLSPRKPGSLR